MDKGWVKLNRQILEHWVWQDKPFNKSAAWIDLILLAEHSDHKKVWRGASTLFERGKVNMSIKALADRWGWSRGKTMRFLRTLEEDNMIIINATTYRTTLTLVNYDVYQGRRTTDRTSDSTTDRTSDDTTDGKHYKNVKNDKEIKEGAEQLLDEAPAPEEQEELSEAYCTEEEWESLPDI